MKIRNNLSEILSLCREIKGLTLRQVEEATGISNAYISQLENGVAENVSFLYIIRLSKFYGVSIDRLASAILEDERERKVREDLIKYSQLGVEDED